MKAMSYEDSIAKVEYFTQSLMTELLSFKDTNIASYVEKDTYFTIDKLKPYLELDLLNILLYQKRYGQDKLKALLKPWVSNLIQAYGLEDVLYVIDDFGRCKIFACKTAPVIVPSEINFIKRNNSVRIVEPAKR